MIKTMCKFLAGVAGLSCLTASLLAAPATALPGAPGAKWHLVWSDEFNQPNGSAPDPAKWSYDIGGNGWGNHELEYYTSRTNNVRIEDGKLVIEACRENFGGRTITSGRLLTKGKCSWTYGRFEARIKVPRGQGMWPAFWLLGTDIDSVGWPASGEIDIMENIGKEPGTIHGTIHGPGYSGDNGLGGPITLPNGTAVSDNYHVFAVECETNSIRWFMDGREYFSVTPASLPKNARWVFNTPKFMLLNLAVGGHWPGDPDNTTILPQSMFVDYVRVYSESPATPASAPAHLNASNQ